MKLKVKKLFCVKVKEHGTVVDSNKLNTQDKYWINHLIYNKIIRKIYKC